MRKPTLKDFEEYTEGLPVAASVIGFVSVAVVPVLAFSGGAVFFRAVSWLLAGFPVVGR